MRNNPLRIARILMLLACVPTTALAQWAVIDAGNIAQSTATAANTAAQLLKQAEQMKLDAERWAKQLQSLRELGWEDSYKLREHLDFLDSLRSKTDAITFNYRDMDRKFRDLYSTKGQPIEQKFANWNDQTENSIRAALKSHGAIKDSQKTMESVSSLVEKQRRAQGNLAAIQTLGELAAIQSRQIEDLKNVITLDSRAKQSQMAGENAQQKAVAEHEKYLVSDLRTKEKTRPMKKLPNLGQGTN